MAKNLNKNRILVSRFAFVAMIAVVLFTRAYWPDENPAHEVMDLCGNFLVSLCAMGRIYSTAFLGGFKNDHLVTHGVYSIIRNPLYFFSLIGVTGIGLISNHLVVVIGLPLVFLVTYLRLIAREEVYLQEKFGAEFKKYKKNVPVLWPKFSAYRAPQKIEMSPAALNRGLADAVWWLAAFPLIELIEYFQENKVVPVFFN